MVNLLECMAEDMIFGYSNVGIEKSDKLVPGEISLVCDPEWGKVKGDSVMILLAPEEAKDFTKFKYRHMNGFIPKEIFEKPEGMEQKDYLIFDNFTFNFLKNMRKDEFVVFSLDQMKRLYGEYGSRDLFPNLNMIEPAKELCEIYATNKSSHFIGF